jgi:hypothetical protein
MYLSKIDPVLENFDIWNTFIEKNKDQIITIAHNPSLIDILSRTFGYKPESYFITKDKKLIGVLPGVRIGKKFVSLPHFSYGGPIFIGGCDNSKVKIKELLPNEIFDIRSFDILSDYVNDDKIICYLKLYNTVEKQWDSLKSKLRSQIKKGQSYGSEVIAGGVELLSDFYIVYSQNMLRLGSPPLPKIFFENIFKYYRFGRVEITVVKIEGLPVAVGMTLSYMGFKEICWASSDYRYNKYNVNLLLYWEVVKKSIIENNEIFSFGRSSKDSNTFKFKQQWEPVVVPIYFNYDKMSTINIKKVTSLSSLWKYQPLNLSVFLGRIISKYLY